MRHYAGIKGRDGRYRQHWLHTNTDPQGDGALACFPSGDGHTICTSTVSSMSTDGLHMSTYYEHGAHGPGSPVVRNYTMWHRESRTGHWHRGVWDCRGGMDPIRHYGNAASAEKAMRRSA